MPGFNYGGKGDGTGWSSERGSTTPGGGDNGHAGNRDGNGNGGSSSSWAGTGPLNGALINAAIAEALNNQLTRNTLPATTTPAYKAMRAAFDSLPVEQQPVARDQITQAWQRAHDAMPDKVTQVRETGGRNGRTFYSQVDNQTKIIIGRFVPQVTNDLNQALVRNQETDVLQKSSELITDVGEKISAYLGDKYKQVAKDIAVEVKNFQGKNIRGFDDAMKSLNKITSNPAMNISQADRSVLINAWQHINAQDMANKLGNLSKAFKVADVMMKVEKVREKSIEGYETGNWGPLMLEVESWVLSGIASAVALGIFSATLGVYALSLGAPAIVVGIAGILLAAAVGALIDDKFADALNNGIIRPAH